MLVLIFFTLPFFAEYVSHHLSDEVEQQLQTKELAWVNVTMQGRDVTLSGTTQQRSEHQRALQVTRSIWFVKQVTDNIIPKFLEPYQMTMRWNGGTLSLKGYVADDDAKKSLQQQVNQQFKDKTIKLDVQTAVGDPANWNELNTVLLEQIRKMPLVSVYLIDQSVEIAGKVQTENELKALKQALSFFETEGYQFNFQVVVLDNAALTCQKEFNHLLSMEKIRFNTGTLTIDNQSDALLSALADTAIFCANSTILISGHTDNVGLDTANSTLSLQRAKVVKGRLFTRGGVPLERLKIVGKGASEPIADNETEAGRAINRRIEFTVEGI
jgi:OOP family OmpA-OmpF porin